MERGFGISRRCFLGGAAALGASAALAQPRVTARDFERATVIDAQGLVTNDPAGIAAVRAAGADAISMTVAFVGHLPNIFEAAVQHIARANAMIAAHPELLLKVETAADLDRAKQSRRTGIVYNFQDSTPFGTDLGRVETFKGLGLRVVQLTYNKRNLAGDGCLERADAGLSDFGRQLIQAIEGHKLLLDLSHGGRRTTAEAIAAATRPPAITHSGCRALADLPRNVDDSAMRALADRGGVFGVYFMPFLRTAGQVSADDVVRHLDHAVNVCGEDHVGIGTDNAVQGIVVDEAAREQHRRDFEQRRAGGIASPGEGPEAFPLVPDYNGAHRYRALARDLTARGWPPRRVEKVIGGNWARLLRDAWA